MRKTQDPRLVWLASYPRSGNSWVRFLLGAYACGEVSDWTVCNQASSDLHNLLGEARGNDEDHTELFRRIRQRFDATPASDYRIQDMCIKTHFPWTPQHPWRDHTHKAIYILRHPKDVLLSCYNYLQVMRKETRSELDAAWDFIHHGGEPRWLPVFGTWFAHYESWNLNPAFPTLLVRFEDLKKDTLAAFLRVVAFLELPIDHERARKAVADTSIEILRRLEIEIRERERLTRFKEGRYLIHQGKSHQSLAQVGPGLDQAFEEAFARQLEVVGYS